jgi:hypothetical protein
MVLPEAVLGAVDPPEASFSEKADLSSSYSNPFGHATAGLPTRINRPTRSKYPRGGWIIFTCSRQISSIHIHLVIHYPLSIGCRTAFDWM